MTPCQAHQLVQVPDMLILDAWGPAFTDDVTHNDWLYVGKCTDAVCVYFARESKYDNISAKELLTFEAGVCRTPKIPTQNVFCCYCNCF